MTAAKKKGGPARAAKLTPEKRRGETSEAARPATVRKVSRKDLELCLEAIKDPKNAGALRRLTKELREVVLDLLYRNA